MAQNASMPPLLRATQQLGDAWWAQNMQRLLVDQGSARAVTLSCKQLRRLYQGGRRALWLDGDDLQESAAVARLAAHFPACKQLRVSVHSSDDLAFYLPDALDALTGMTRLSGLMVDVADAAGAADPCAMVMTLQGVRRLLAAGRLAPAAAAAAVSDSGVEPSFELHLKLYNSGTPGSWHDHPRVWQAIGQLQVLSSLQLHAAGAGVKMLPSSIAHMSALANLGSTLHTLWIEPTLEQLQQNEVVDYSALGSLSRLTRLGLPLAAERQGLSSIGSCSQLQHLSLQFKGVTGAAQQVTLQPSELQALGRLTQLTELSLGGAACGDRAGWSFLSTLQQLQQLHVTPGLPHAAVAALAHLTCLTQLTCGWEHQQEGQPQVAARCVALRVLFLTEGAPPLCAFPGLTSLVQREPWDPSVLSSVAECCTQLKVLQLHDALAGSVFCERGSLRVSAPAAARTAAVSSLAALQNLQYVELSVNDIAEVAAASALPQVERLYLMVPTSSSCSVQGLAVLAAMRQLQHLILELTNSSRSRVQEADVQLLLTAVRHVPNVQFRVQKNHVNGVRGVVRRAERVLTEQGLQLAARVVVNAIED